MPLRGLERAWRPPFLHLADGLETWAAALPQGTALLWMEGGVLQRTTRRAWVSQVCNAASALRRLGLSPGDRVALNLPNGPQATTIALAIVAAGGSAVLLDDDPRACSTQWSVGGDAEVSRSLDPRLLLEAADAPWPETVRGVANEALVGATSGTTGRPRAARLSLRALLFSAAASAAHLPRSRRGTVLLRHTARFDRLQIYSALTAMLAGGALAFGPADLAPQTLRALGVTVLRATPSTFQRLLDEAGTAGVRARLGGTVTHGISSGARLDADLARAWQQQGVPLLQHYGSTETSVVALHGPRGADPDTVGRVPQWVRVRIDAEGRVAVRTPGAMQSYLDAPDLDPQAWIAMGDRGALRSDRSLVIHGRHDDALVTSRGRKVDRERLEARLLRLPHVRRARVLGDGEPQPWVALWLNVEEEGDFTREVKVAWHEMMDSLPSVERPVGGAACVAAPPDEGRLDSEAVAAVARTMRSALDARVAAGERCPLVFVVSPPSCPPS